MGAFSLALVPFPILQKNHGSVLALGNSQMPASGGAQVVQMFQPQALPFGAPARAFLFPVPFPFADGVPAVSARAFLRAPFPQI